jgi:hypothetical protein
MAGEINPPIHLLIAERDMRPLRRVNAVV